MAERLADHCGRYLSELATSDDRIRVLDGDLADSDGAVHFALAHPDRFYMGGIAEQSLVSISAGMASCGLRPFVFSFAAFLCYRAYDQIRVCLSQARQPVTLVGSHSGGCSGRNGKTHAALNDIGLMATLPNLRVWAPGSVSDVVMAIDTALCHPEPMYIRLPRAIVADLPGHPSACRWIGASGNVALVGTGFSTSLAVAASTLLQQAGVDVGVLHCPCLVPLPIDTLRALTTDVAHMFVIEDHYNTGGLAQMLQAKIQGLNIIPITWPSDWSGESGMDADLLQRYGMDGEGIAKAVMISLARRR